MEKKIYLDRNGMHIGSPEIAEKIQKKKISASMISALEGCHAQWLAGTFVIPDLMEEEPDNAMTRGSLFHSVMEEFFKLEPEERTKETLNEVTAEVLSKPEYIHFRVIPDAITWLKTAIRNYYDFLEENPKEVRVAQIDGKLGLERFVSGKIGNSERSTLGFIDRIVEDPENPGSVIVEDWKTGANAKKWNPKTKSDDGLKEARQQVLYSLLLEQSGEDVSGARLLFPMAKTIVDVDTEDVDFRKRVVADVEKTDRTLDSLIESNDFEFKPNFLCSFCPLSKICPSAMLKNHIKKDGTPSKLKLAFDNQPDPSILEKGIDFGSRH